MKRKLLPSARVIPDVAEVPKEVRRLRLSPDMVVAGFPCQGFSSLGLRTGLQHEGSGLFRELINIIDSCDPPLLFLENVEAISSMSHDFSVILRSLTRRGYALSWTIVAASDLGAPQRRARWFCLASKPQAWERRIAVPFVEKFVWSRATEPRHRMRVEPNASDHIRRWHMLGNSVCPDAVRLAFLHLWSGGQIQALPDQRIWYLPMRAYLPPDHYRPASMPSNHGYAYGPRRPRLLAPSPATKTAGIQRVRRTLNTLVLDPRLYHRQSSSIKQRGIITTPRLRKPREVFNWATPRAQAHGSSQVLTERAMRDLESQARFATSTSGNRGGRLRIEWVEWLMGYPEGWTAT
jgi:site-specific DNA-cytosine methylase